MFSQTPKVLPGKMVLSQKLQRNQLLIENLGVGVSHRVLAPRRKYRHIYFGRVVAHFKHTHPYCIFPLNAKRCRFPNGIFLEGNARLGVSYIELEL